jgi:RHS repeat-associated protein
MPAVWAEAIAERNVLRYASYVYDAHCGLYYLQRRFYDPVTRQFLSRDPLRADGDESPYQYCGGDPVAQVDPWGLYVTASGERDDPQIYVPQAGLVVAKGVGTGHRGALGGDASDLYLPWQGSLGKLSTPGLASQGLRLTGEFFRTGLELAAFLCCDPWAHPFGDDPNVENGASLAFMFVDPFAAGGSALRSGALVADDLARGVGAALRGTRGVRGGDVAARRVGLRVGTRDAIRSSAPRAADGRIVDEFSRVVIPQGGAFHYAHRPGLEWWRTQRLAREQGWTRRQLIEYENNPLHYYIADPYSNMSHRWESPR